MMPICSKLSWLGFRTQFKDNKRLQFSKNFMCLAFLQGNERAARPEPCAAGFVCPAGTSNRTTGAAQEAAAEDGPAAEEGAELPGAYCDLCSDRECY